MFSWTTRRARWRPRFSSFFIVSSSRSVQLAQQYPPPKTEIQCFPFGGQMIPWPIFQFLSPSVRRSPYLQIHTPTIYPTKLFPRARVRTKLEIVEKGNHISRRFLSCCCITALFICSKEEKQGTKPRGDLLYFSSLRALPTSHQLLGRSNSTLICKPSRFIDSWSLL